ncbi:hypothetical protein [Streptomyces sp. NPDC059593]|uniref:hypothetical protein n=1 Tax=Streptomyces sp. NPDC059593 TaxID=3346878 RepID=UPI0036785C71
MERAGGERAGAEPPITVHNGAGIVIVGDGNRIGPPEAAAVRSGYGEQVRRIAPTELLDREAELAELAAFCRADSGPTYTWWRAEAWAGKTALLSWFALDPPPGVRIVPFFVTARLGAQNDVVAYVDVVLEQLAELAGEGLPALLTAATREAHLLRLYASAAAACAARGERLVLLVDGLDEDRGVTTGPDAHSIASLLPYGLRVIVSGRLNPPLPVDVPDDHPLRDPGAVRILSPSPAARAVRVEAERELKHLLTAGGLPYELLALLAAAGGGLTADDLVELTGAVPYRVKDVLRTGQARTFALRGDGYVLAHEELAAGAGEMLGVRELDRARAAVHAWAGSWRDRGWPGDTPGYLLRGYPAMLRETGDTDRMVGCALDPVRHDRLLAATGGDGAALGEVWAASEAVLARGERPDLVALMLRLEIRRDGLEQRGALIPPELVVAWAAVDEVDRAVALARAQGDERAVAALCAVALKLLERGEPERAAELVSEAEESALRQRHADRRDVAADAVAMALVALGAHDRAERQVRRIGSSWYRSGPLDALVRSLCAAGEYAPALGLARDEPEPLLRADARSVAVRSLARAGRGEEAERVAREPDPCHAVRAVVLLRAAAELPGRDALLAEGLRACDAAGHDGEDGGLRNELIRALVAVGGPAWTGRLRHWRFTVGDVPDLAAALGRAGEWDDAWALVDELEGEDAAWARLGFAEARLESGDLDTAQELAQRSPMVDQGEFWERLAEARLARDELDEADELTDLLARSVRGFAVIGALAGRRIRRGEAERALAEVAQWARVMDEVRLTAPMVGAVAEALHDEGWTADARALLASAEEAGRRPPRRDTAMRLARTAQALAGSGRRDEALGLLEAFRPDGVHDDYPEEEVVPALLAAGLPDRAEAYAWGTVDDDGARLFPGIIAALIAEGAYMFAERLIQVWQEDDEDVVAAAVGAYAAVGDTNRAGALAGRLSSSARAAGSHAVVALALAGQGRAAEATGRLDTAMEATLRTVAISAVMLPDVVRALIALGRRDEATALLAEATDGLSTGYGLHQPAHVPRAWAVAGEYDHAVAAAGALPYGAADRGLLSLATDLARAGLYERAEALLAGLHHMWPECAGAYAVLAVEHPDPARARRLTALALHLGPWYDALPAVLVRAPGTVPLVLDEADRLRRALEV